MGFISSPAPLEILVILGIALLVLGPKRLPEAARSVGRGIREMRDALQGGDDDDEPDELPEFVDEEEEGTAAEAAEKPAATETPAEKA